MGGIILIPACDFECGIWYFRQRFMGRPLAASHSVTGDAGLAGPFIRNIGTWPDTSIEAVSSVGTAGAAPASFNPWAAKKRK